MTTERFSFSFSLLLSLAVLLTPTRPVSGHGRLLRPTSRSSVWRFAEFQSQNPPPNYTDNQLFCGGLHQADSPGTNCGVCGDPVSDSVPRENEIAGYYYRGIITGRYTQGQVRIGIAKWRVLLKMANMCNYICIWRCVDNWRRGRTHGSSHGSHGMENLLELIHRNAKLLQPKSIAQGRWFWESSQCDIHRNLQNKA